VSLSKIEYWRCSRKFYAMNGYESFGLGRKRGNTILIGSIFELSSSSRDRDASTWAGTA